MAKPKSNFVCNNCGGTTPKLMGKCPHCGTWGSIEEEVSQESYNSSNRYSTFTKLSSKVEDLSEISINEYNRLPTDISEFDRVLGGGLVAGSVVLIGGDPGIGKSTLLLQVLSSLTKNNKVLYISGEESSEQIAGRGKRIGLPLKGIKIYSDIELEKIRDQLNTIKPDFVVIDSIQTLFSGQLSSAPGSVSQVKECASQLNRYAKENNTTMVIICHVTKDGELAGPRALEHIVDSVLYFEGDKANQYRMIRAIKNRFGPLNEVGIFDMTSEGLLPITDPTGIFSSGNKTPLPGSSIYVTQEGNRSIMVEVQALLDQTPLPNPLRRSIGIDLNRLQMLCAVIHKFVDLPIYTFNVFLTLIGGMKFTDTGVDLPAFLAMISSYRNIPLKLSLASFGEIALTGELKQVNNPEDRIREAARLGIKNIVCPILNQKLKATLAKELSINIMECLNIEDVLSKCFDK